MAYSVLIIYDNYLNLVLHHEAERDMVYYNFLKKVYETKVAIVSGERLTFCVDGSQSKLEQHGIYAIAI